ncbi:hypothetical protein QAD02_012778 [Eretmocerus hayati]|uniref:Uncharacterized protein n=1 Tax=Eretmocerus hayati TaxID=131215 RepID=A0ACC2P2E3_9HYME|nr:hypothetical protein QAD02_012778 [Eretmocerus hayati]
MTVNGFWRMWPKLLQQRPRSSTEISTARLLEDPKNYFWAVSQLSTIGSGSRCSGSHCGGWSMNIFIGDDALCSVRRQICVLVMDGSRRRRDGRNVEVSNRLRRRFRWQSLTTNRRSSLCGFGSCGCRGNRFVAQARRIDAYLRCGSLVRCICKNCKASSRHRYYYLAPAGYLKLSLLPLSSMFQATLVFPAVVLHRPPAYPPSFWEDHPRASISTPKDV